MGVLADVKQVDRKDGIILAHKCAVDTVYQGGMAKLNAAGFLAPCAAEANAVFAGIVYETVANESPYAAGDQSARVYKEGVFLLEAASAIFSATTVGQAVYATDDNNITLTYASNIQRVGVIVAHESTTKAWVKIQPGVLGLEAAIADAATDAASAIATVNLVLGVMRKHNMIEV